MDKKMRARYEHVIESLEDIAYCTKNELILVGGTALAIFYLKHRLSVDLDFVPLGNESEEKLKERFKGALSREGYNTGRTTFTNQFAIHFGDSSVRIEIFQPKRAINRIVEFPVGGSKLNVASIEDLLEMKVDAYCERKEARDIFDIVAILKRNKQTMDRAIEIVKKFGAPKNMDDLEKMVIDHECHAILMEVLKNVD